MIAVRQSGQPLDVHAQQAGEGFGLGFAQLRELRRHILHRAMPLAQLYAAQGRRCRLVAHGAQAGVEAVAAQRADEPFCALGGADVRGELRGIPALPIGDPSPRKVLDGVRADGLREIAQGLAGKVVVARGERAVAGVGDDIRLGGAAAAPG